MLEKLLLSAAMLLPATALAAHVGVTLSPDKAITLFQGAPGKQVLPKWTPPAGKTKIFDTLGKGDAYDASEGWTISSPGSDTGLLQWFAYAITPTTSTTVTEIVEAVSFVAGDNSVTIALLADDNGSPGKVLQQKTIKNLQTFGLCCAVAVDHLRPGVPVTANTTYWVAAILPSKKQATTWDAWNFSSANTNAGTAAYYNTSGWNVTSTTYTGFAVYGD